MGQEPDTRSNRAWELAARQHGIVTRQQLLALGFGRRSIEHRLARGRLFRVSLDLIDPEALREDLSRFGGEPGIRLLRHLLDKLFFRLSDSDLEIYFRRIVRAANLPLPLTKQRVNRFEVDFFWPDLGSSWRRFTHYEVRYEPRRVRAELAKTIAMLRNRIRL